MKLMPLTFQWAHLTWLRRSTLSASRAFNNAMIAWRFASGTPTLLLYVRAVFAAVPLMIRVLLRRHHWPVVLCNRPGLPVRVPRKPAVYTEPTSNMEPVNHFLRSTRHLQFQFLILHRQPGVARKNTSYERGLLTYPLSAQVDV